MKDKEQELLQAKAGTRSLENDCATLELSHKTLESELSNADKVRIDLGAEFTKVHTRLQNWVDNISWNQA